MTTEERLEALERELADTRKELADLRVGLAAGLTTRKVEIVDENGKVRALLTMLDGPVLDLTDEKGEIRAMLTVGNDGAGLHLLDENGKPIWSAP